MTTVSLNPWQAVEVSGTLDCGADVDFTDPAGRSINATGIMLSTGGAVKWREKGQSDAAAVVQTFRAGVWHNIHCGAIIASGTGKNLGIHVMSRHEGAP